MKNKNEVRDILRYANIYLPGNVTLLEIDDMQKQEEMVKTSSISNARVAKKI